MSAKPVPRQELRTLIAQGAIGVMVCLGAHMLLVDSVEKKLKAARAQESSIASQASAADTLRRIAPQITSASQKAAEEAARIRETGHLASNEKELFAAVSMLATRHNIRVDQMTPHKLVPISKTPGTPTTPAAATDGVTGVAYTIDATANYADLADFLRALRTELGYTAVKSLRISPSTDTRQKLVHAVIETEHYAFTVLTQEQMTAAAAGGSN